ncbi:MAG: type II toxin-antitoxin system Phd/YefM family antitoxin [Pseudomonadota bacterium]
MTTINIHEAKSTFSRLIENVLQGGDVTIAKAGKPVAKLVPIKEPKIIRKPGSLKGQIFIADDFDAPLPSDLQATFEGR